jgi:hypothetical protein
MPKIVSADMDLADTAIKSLLNSIGAGGVSDFTCGSDRVPTAYYVYGSVSESSFGYKKYGKPIWYAVTTRSGQTLAYCDSIFFWDEYDEYGNFLGRRVSIEGSVGVAGYLLPMDIVYSYDAGGFGFYINRIIINDYGAPLWNDFPLGLAGSGYYDGSSTLVTQKLRWLRWGEIRSIDAYWGSLNNYEVVRIGNSYYFKIPNYNALLPGNGTEGTVKTIDVTVVNEEFGSVSYMNGSDTILESGSVYYLSGIEQYEEGYLLGIAKQLKARFELA